MISDNIRSLRKKAGMSQEQMAEALNVSRQAVTKWETDGGTPDLGNVVAIAQLFRVSVDELLGVAPAAEDALADAGATGTLYETVTQCDVVGPCDFDIDYGTVRKLTIAASQSEKLRVQLTSETVEDLASQFKVRLDTEGRSFDVEVVKTGEITAAAAHASVDCLIELPAEWNTHVELTGTAQEIQVFDIAPERLELVGKFDCVLLDAPLEHVELDCNENLAVDCRQLPQRLDINQVRAISRVAVPQDAAFRVRSRGIGNSIVLDSVSETPDAACLIELAGFKSELTVGC
ncbi:MAG: helix-turn-helix transcriptional regulator [Coriobacteriales bacterium]|nr:helix-turn-helix transcriptional regulator [Coriobacteriales bacterium]